MKLFTKNDKETSKDCQKHFSVDLSSVQRSKPVIWEHCIQRITFAAETNAACSRDSAETQQ